MVHSTNHARFQLGSGNSPRATRDGSLGHAGRATIRWVGGHPWRQGHHEGGPGRQHAGGGPVAGFYNYGEIARTSGISGFHNQTLVVFALS